MTTSASPVFREALRLMSPTLILKQLLLALLVLVLSLAWLRVPDASWLDVCASVLLALLVLALAGCGESALLLSLVGQLRTPRRLLRGALLLLAGAVLWAGWHLLLNHLNWSDPLHAAYLNSRLPFAMRSFFSYERILLWLGWVSVTVNWISAGIIAAFFIAAVPSARPLRAAAVVLQSPGYWLTLLLGSAGSTFVSRLLLHWSPGHGLRVEMLSLALRISVIAVVDAVIVCLLLAILAVGARVSNQESIAPAGTPFTSQPRTAEIP